MASFVKGVFSWAWDHPKVTAKSLGVGACGLAAYKLHLTEPYPKMQEAEVVRNFAGEALSAIQDVKSTFSLLNSSLEEPSVREAVDSHRKNRYFYDDQACFKSWRGMQVNRLRAKMRNLQSKRFTSPVKERDLPFTPWWMQKRERFAVTHNHSSHLGVGAASAIARNLQTFASGVLDYLSDSQGDGISVVGREGLLGEEFRFKQLPPIRTEAFEGLCHSVEAAAAPYLQYRPEEKVLYAAKQAGATLLGVLGIKILSM